MKRLFALLAAVVFAMAFVACGGGQTTDSSTPIEESATTDVGDTGMGETTGMEDTGMDTGMEETDMDTGTDEMDEGGEEPIE